jgi:hypothetical protein
MLKEIGTWYFDYGWMITTIFALPLGGLVGYTKHHERNLFIPMVFLLILGLTMLAFKHIA